MANQASNTTLNASTQGTTAAQGSATGQATIVATELLEPHPGEAAFSLLLPEFQALADADHAHINVDVLGAVTTVLGALPRIRALREEIAEELPRFNLARFDKLEQYTLALSHAHTWSRASLIPKAEVTERAALLDALRDQLLDDAKSLAGHKVLNFAPLKKCKTVPGYSAIAEDVLTIVKVLKDHWAQAQGKTGQTASTLNAAASSALELLAAMGLREQGAGSTDEPASMRRKAFTLFRRAYDDAQRAVGYLRDEAEAEDIAPSLYAGRGGRRAASESGEHEVHAATAGTASPGSAAVTSSTAATTGALGAASTLDTAFAVDNRAGLPITHPLKD